MKYGIKETKEMLDLGFELAKAGKAALADGKVNFFDLPVIIPVFAKVGPAVDGAAMIPAELGDIDEFESKELIDYAKAKLPEIVDDAFIKNRILVYLKAGLAVAEAISVSK